MWNDLMYRMRVLLRRERVDDEMDEELGYHLEREAEKHRLRGVPADEAHRLACIALGGREQARQKIREDRGTRLVEEMTQDLRFAVRQLRRNPGFTATAILVFALGIGAATAIFTFVDAALVKPLPYRDPARLMALYERIPVGDRYHLSFFDYDAWKKRNHSFEALEAYRPNIFPTRTAEGAEQVNGALVSDGFFRMLGVAPMLGRDFAPGEDAKGAPQNALVSYDAWQKRFGGDKNVIGRTFTLEGTPTVIIGVLPANFHFAPVGRAEFWKTIHGYCREQMECFPYYGLARLKRGVSRDAAFEDLSGVARQIAVELPQSNRDRSATLIPLTDAIFDDVRPTLVALLGGAALLCLIGFVNVSSLLLVRAESRRREFAVRGALGASRVRLVRQFAVEGFVLAACGCGLGLGLTFGAMRLLAGQIPANLMDAMPYLAGVHFNTHVVVFAVAVSLLGAVCFSAGPALHLLFSDMQAGLVAGGRSGSGSGWRRLGSGLVAVELAITVVLLVSAGLLTKSFYRLLHVDIGMQQNHLASVHVSRLGPDTDDAADIRLEREVLARMKALPGVVSVGVANEQALGSGEHYSHLFAHFRVVGHDVVGQGMEASDHVAGVGYFEALRVRLLKGRFFDEHDDRSRLQVAIVNRTFAEQNFAGEEAIGQHIVNQYDTQHPSEVVGVVDDLKDGPLDMKATGSVYTPFNEMPVGDFYVTVRTSQSERAVLPAMVKAVHALDAGLLADGEETMTDRINNSQAAYLHRSAAWVVAGFAALALLLGIVGLYGVVSYSVGQRRREIGVRMALGAQRGTIYQLILKESGRLAAVGIVVGLGCSMAASGLLRSLLFGVSRWDVETMVGVAVVLYGAALAASYFPARDAASISPTEALRAE